MQLLILRPRALCYRTGCTRRSKFLTHALTTNLWDKNGSTGWVSADVWTLRQPLASAADAWLARASWLPLWRHITCAHASAAGFPTALGRGYSLMQWPCVRERAPAVVVCVVVGEALSYCFPFRVKNQGRVVIPNIHAKFVMPTLI